MTLLANYAAFATAMEQLANNHPTLCSRFDLAHNAQSSGRPVHALRIPAAPPADRPVAVIMGGIHAREVATAPSVLSFAVKLVNARAANGDVTYPAFSDGAVPYGSWSILAADVQRLFDGLALIVVPVVNPDGRDQVVVAGDAGWRGNRNTAACPGFGVDLNRNFDIGWDTAKYYSAADEAVIVPLGTDPNCSEIFRGPPPAGLGVARVIEPETLNIQELVDDNDVRCLVDVHSQGRRVLTPWGLADNQDSDPTQSFTNAAHDRQPGNVGGRSVLSGAYKEFLPNDAPHRVKVTHEQMAQAMVQAIVDQAGPNATARARSTYLVRQVPYLYKEQGALPHIVPVPGSSVDYAVSRQFKPGESGPTFGLAMEIGYDATGLPGTDPETDGGHRPSNLVKFQKIEREAHAGLAALLKALVGAATGKKRKKS